MTPNLAFLGTGMMGQLSHLGNYARLRDSGHCTIAGICDLQHDLAEKVAAHYKIDHIYADLAAILADASVDAVICIQQWPNNYPLVKRILTAGKSVLTEKPMVGRLDEAEELRDLAAATNVHYAVGFMKRYDFGVDRVKTLLAELQESNELGTLVMVDSVCNGGDWTFAIEDPIRVPWTLGDVQSTAPTYPDACNSPTQRTNYDWLVNIFSHTVNLCHYLLGTELTVASAHFSKTRAFTSISHAEDVPVTIRGAQVTSHEWREWTTLTFERGELTVRTPVPMRRQTSASVELLRPSRGRFVTETHHVEPGWAFFNQAHGFVRTLAGEDSLRTPATLAVQDVRVMERMITVAQ